MSLPDTKGCIAFHYFGNNSVETPEERIEIRLLQYKVQTTAPYAATNSHCFNSVSFKAKMQKFHANMATLDKPTCSTCSERIPGSFHPKPNGYLCCSSNKHAPK